jgi:hypothetical protein
LVVEKAHARAIEKQDFKSGFSFAKKDEERAAASGTADLFFDQAAQTLKPPAQIDRLQTHEDFDATGDHD